MNIVIYCLSEKIKRSCSYIHLMKTKLIHVEKWDIIWVNVKMEVNKMQELTVTSFEPLWLTFVRHGLRVVTAIWFPPIFQNIK